MKCENCRHSLDCGESFLFVRCIRLDHQSLVRKDFCCKHYLSKKFKDDSDIIYEAALSYEDIADGENYGA